MRKPTIIKLMLLSAILLAVSYAMPVAYQPIVLDDNGEPAGWMAQASQAHDAVKVRDYAHYWEDLPLWTLAVFLVPLGVAVLRWRGGQTRTDTALRFAAPVLGVGALSLLVGMVTAADFDLWPLSHNELAYGAYVSLGALTLFCLTALLSLRNAPPRLVRGRDPRRWRADAEV
jgi:hypothetical protein